MNSRYSKGSYRYEVVLINKGDEVFGGKFSSAEEAHAWGKAHSKLNAYKVREIKPDIKPLPNTNVIPFPKKQTYSPIEYKKPTSVYILLLLGIIIVSIGYVAIKYLHYLS